MIQANQHPHNYKISVAIIGSGNIGTDLMIKVMRHSRNLKMGAMVGIDPLSDGLARARSLGVPVTSDGIDGLLALPNFAEIGIVFDATSAGAHVRNNALLQPHGVRVIDLTPAAIGPYVVPVVNLQAHADATNINMVTCGGQATIPMVHAVAQVTTVHYAEIVASIASKSAGPGTRANIDEFTETTSRAIVEVGGARFGKAIIVLNPAEPPLIMRDTIYCLTDLDADQQKIKASVSRMAQKVAAYVPGYTLKQEVQFERYDAANPLNVAGIGKTTGLKVSIFVEVRGAAHYLPEYAGNLDIMTSAAVAAAEQFAHHMLSDQKTEI